MNPADTPNKIVIEGITLEGKEFRPSDWAERMCGNLAEFKRQRIHYDDRLVPIVNDNGNKCVLLDPELKQSNPELYLSILEFAQTNKLRICNNEDDQTSAT